MLDDRITLDYGSGGQKTSELIETLLVPSFQNDALSRLGDGAVLPALPSQPVFSTDSFVVSPWRFPGGNVGKLAVCGTVNDVCMAGGEPLYLSLAMVIEEGFPLESLREIVQSAAETAREAGVQIVTGDTKVVERGACDGIYLNTAGIGALRAPGLSPRAIREGDSVIVSGSVGCHGAAVMMARAGLGGGALRSDCMALHRLSAAVLACGGVHVLRDPTRGGAATTLCEFAESAALGIELDEAAIPVRRDVAAACALLGLDPLYCANEGKMLAVVAPEDAEAALETLRSRPEGENAAIIGRVTAERPGKVVLRTRAGGGRILQKLSGAQLPRIC